MIHSLFNDVSCIDIHNEGRMSYNKNSFLILDEKQVSHCLQRFVKIKDKVRTILNYQMNYGCNSMECNCPYCASSSNFIFFFNKDRISSYIDEIIEKITVGEFLDYVDKYQNYTDDTNYIFFSKNIKQYFCKNIPKIVMNLQISVAKIQILERLFNNIIQNKTVSTEDKQVFKELLMDKDYFSYLFMNKDNKNQLEFAKIDKETLNINIKELENLQKQILSRNCKLQSYLSCFTSLLDSFKQLIVHESDKSQQNSLNYIRGVLLLTINHRLFQHPFISSNFYAIIDIIYNLKEKELLLLYMARSRYVFSNFLNLLNDNLTYIIQMNKISIHSEFIGKITSIIDLMFQINNSNKIKNHKPLPLSHFINKKLSEEVDINQEKNLFLNKNPGSFLFKPSLLTTKCKYDLAHSFLIHGSEKHIQVSRTYLLYHTIELFSNLPDEELRNGIRVKFGNEIGVDYGGITKEYLELVSTKLFSNEQNYFLKLKSNGCVYFNFQKAFDTDIKSRLLMKKYYKIAGQILGLIWRENMKLPFRLAPQVFKLMKREDLTEQDIKEIDEEKFASLMCMKKMKEENKSIEDLSLFFTLTTSDSSTHAVKEIPLIKGGECIPVTNDNIDYFIHYHMTLYKNNNVKECIIDPFINGFINTAENIALQLLRSDELNELLNCNKYNINWAIFKSIIEYENWKDNETIIDFWNIFDSWCESDKKKFLKFVTGSASEPIQGFSNIKITFVRGADLNYLPVAHTCTNMFVLPDYRNIDTLRSKLNICLSNAETFGII